VKWVGFIIVVAAIGPLVGWLRRNPNAIIRVLMLMGFLPWALGTFHLYMAIISWVDWPGFAKGAEFSVLDALALAVYFSLPRARHPLPFRLLMALYFVAVSLSVFQARVPMAAIFYPWQLVRMYLVYAAITKACATDPRAPRALMNGMIAGLFFEAGFVIWERFGLGMIQAGGSEGHQNLLGLMSHFVVFPFFALLLSGERGWLPAAGTLAGVVVQVLTTSRATLGLAGFGYATAFLLSAVRQWTSKKGLVLLIGVLAVALLTPVVMSAFNARFAAEDWGTYDERAAFERAAAMMLSDHPLGVGANQFATVAIVDGYYLRAGVHPNMGSLTAHVHNIYWLVTAETGYLGLLTFVLLLLRPITVAFLCGWRHRGDRRGDLLLGLGMALLIVYIHSFFEWIFITYQAQYMFALELGLIAGLAQQLGYWRQPAHLRGHSYRQSPAWSRRFGIRADKKYTAEFKNSRSKL
jgi:O-antigen ligase